MLCVKNRIKQIIKHNARVINMFCVKNKIKPTKSEL